MTMTMTMTTGVSFHSNPPPRSLQALSSSSSTFIDPLVTPSSSRHRARARVRASATQQTPTQPEEKTSMSPHFQLRLPARTRLVGGPSVWIEFTPLSRLTRSLNLGQGAPGWSAPPFVSDALAKAVTDNVYSQYAPPSGAPKLTSHLLDHYTPLLTPTPESADRDAPLPDLRALVTNGASQALSLACFTFLSAGDELVLFEPAFDIYSGSAVSVGAVPRYVPLKFPSSSPENKKPLSSADITIDFNALRNALNDRTKMLIINSPHNPTGKVFSRDEMAKVNALLDEHAPNCIVLSDEVYEHLVYDDVPHSNFASVSHSAYCRTVTISSSGKSLSATGYKIGWAIGPDMLINPMTQMHQFVVFSVSHASQAGIERALTSAHAAKYFDKLRDDYKCKRDYLVNALQSAGLVPIVPQGAFFVCAVVPHDHPVRQNAGEPPQEFINLLENSDDHKIKVQVDQRTWNRTDYNVCRFLTVNYGVTAIPTSAFLDQNTADAASERQCIIRFAFCQPDELLKAARERLLSGGT